MRERGEREERERESEVTEREGVGGLPLLWLHFMARVQRERERENVGSFVH